MKLTLTAAAVTCTVLLASCTTGNQQPYMPRPVQPSGPQSVVDGQWLDKNGIISNFSAGQFETRTSDTNQILATGTFTEVNANMVEIDLTSVLRQTRSRVNCSVVSNYLMNCTPSQGAQFQLYKPSAAPFGFTLDDAANMANNMSANPAVNAAVNTMNQSTMPTVPPLATSSTAQMGLAF